MLRFLTLALLFASFSARAQVIAPSAAEISVNYTAEFILEDNGYDEATQAYDHVQYMFGVLHSPSMVSSYGINPEKIEGLGGPSLPMKIDIKSIDENEEGLRVVKYKASGRLLIQKKAAAKMVKDGELRLQLPYDISKVYLKKCTDSHYTSFGDYWYFWDPFREGCEKLLQPGITHEVVVNVREITATPREQTPNLNRLHGDNGDGELMRVYVLNGFSDSSSESADEGRENFEQVRQVFEERGFDIENVNRSPRIPRNVYTKTFARDGKTMRVEVIHQLSNTDISADAKTFARTFKEAIAEGDLIIYLGHSGLGANLDISNLNQKLKDMGEGGIKFPKNKYQIFFFDSCSSYSYYLPHFRDFKPAGKIDIISYGLSSYFATSTYVFGALIDKTVNLDEPESWETILRSMEEPLDGASYLLNVGGV